MKPNNRIPENICLQAALPSKMEILLGRADIISYQQHLACKLAIVTKVRENVFKHFFSFGA